MGFACAFYSSYSISKLDLWFKVGEALDRTHSSDYIQEKEDGRHKIREETKNNIKRKTMAGISVMGLITVKFDATA